MMVPFNTTVLSMPCDVSYGRRKAWTGAFVVCVYVVCTGPRRRDGEYWIMCLNGTRKLQQCAVVCSDIYFFGIFMLHYIKKGKRRSLVHQHTLSPMMKLKNGVPWKKKLYENSPQEWKISWLEFHRLSPSKFHYETTKYFRNLLSHYTCCRLSSPLKWSLYIVTGKRGWCQRFRFWEVRATYIGFTVYLSMNERHERVIRGAACELMKDANQRWKVHVEEKITSDSTHS